MLVLLGQRGEDGVAEAAFEEMVFDGDDPARRVGGCLQRVGVDRLDRVGVNHSRRDPVLLERVGRLQRLVHRDARADDRDVVVVRRADDAAAADFELLVGPVDHRCVRAVRAQEHDALRVRHRHHELGGLIRVAGMQHHAGVNRSQRSNVLERHLGRAVLADRHACVRACEPEIDAADSRHADEVVGA